MREQLIESVLVVDDDPVFGGFAPVLFKTLGARSVDLAADVATAIQKLRQTKPDLVSLDLNMPDADGIELIQALVESGIDCLVLIVSAADISIRRGAAALANAHGVRIVGVVAKPLDRQKLAALRLPFAVDPRPVCAS